MIQAVSRITVALVCLVLGAHLNAAEINYADQVKPLFRDHCLKCHNSDDAEGELDLSSFAAVMRGGSSGPALMAGRPESSQLYRAIAHLDGAPAMPPESPKLTAEKLAIVRNWIRAGLVAGKGGKPQLRRVASVIASRRPDAEAPIPQSLPVTALSRTVRPPLPQALAVSPGAPLIAVSGHEQILLYSEAKESNGRGEPVAKDQIAREWSFDGDNGNSAGQVGACRTFARQSRPIRVRNQLDFSKFVNLTLTLWIRPEECENNPTVFGQEAGFRLFLERHRDGWRPRLFLRDQTNAISYFGRVGVLPNGKWSHLAIVWNGKTWTWFLDGKNVGRQPNAKTTRQIQQRDDAVQAFGATIDVSGKVHNRFRGAIDELRFYRKALTPDEIVATMREAATVKSYRFLGALPFAEGTLHDLKFSRSGSILLAAGGRGAHSGRVVLFDVRNGKRVSEIGEEVDSVLAADISADHRHVVLGGPSKVVKVFETGTGQLLHRIKKHTDWITAASFSPDGKMFATGDRSGGVYIWETVKGAIVYSLDEHKVRITDIRWRDDGRILATAAEDGNLILWSLKDGFPVRNVVAHANQESPRYSRRTGVLSAAFSPDGRLITSGRDNAVRIWSVDGEPQAEFPLENGLPLKASFLDGGSSAVIGSLDGSLQIIDLAAKTRTQLLSTQPTREAR